MIRMKLYRVPVRAETLVNSNTIIIQSSGDIKNVTVVSLFDKGHYKIVSVKIAMHWRRNRGATGARAPLLFSDRGQDPPYY